MFSVEIADWREVNENRAVQSVSRSAKKGRNTIEKIKNLSLVELKNLETGTVRL